MTGSYPWKTTKDYTTIIYITNISDREAEFVAQINYGAERFVIDPRKLKPGETAVFDLAKIRDEQMPDNVGRRLPKQASLGQFKWAVRGLTGGKLLLIGRAEMVSLSDHISTSYSCNDPCPPVYVMFIDGFPNLAAVNQTTDDFVAWETAQYGNGYNMGPYTGYVSCSVDYPIATYDSADSGHSTTMTGTAPGEAFMLAFSRMEESYGWDGRDCYDNNNQYLVGEGGDVAVVLNIAKLQYQGSSGFVDISGTINVLSGTSVNFKAVPSPASATFPAGKPTWGGSSNAVGNGATITVPFVSVSNSAGDFQTVTATAGGNTVTANVVVFSLSGILTPTNNFNGRSLSRFGVEEDVTLGFATSPSNIDVGGLRWKITSSGGSANGVLLPNDTGGGTYKAPDTARTVGLQLQLLSGPSKDRGPSGNITIVEPSEGFIQKFSGIKHTNNSWSAGFKGDIHITPSDVSFFNLSFFEGSAPANSSGWLAGFPDPHPQSAVAPRIGSQGVVSEQDLIFSGVKFGPYGDGQWFWDIPWSVITNSNRVISIGTIRQLATSNSSGQAVMSKGGASVSRVPSDPTSDW